MDKFAGYTETEIATGKAYAKKFIAEFMKAYDENRLPMQDSDLERIISNTGMKELHGDEFTRALEVFQEICLMAITYQEAEQRGGQ